MNDFYKYSKPLHWITFLCLLLPFFYTGCENTATTTSAVDSTSVDYIDNDSTNKNVMLSDEHSKSSDLTDSSTIEKKEETPSQILSRKHPFLKPILVSTSDTFSGLALLIDSGKYVVFYSNFVFVLLLMLGLTIKYIDKNGLKSIVLIEILSLIFLAISRPMSINSEILWGYWVTIVLVSILTISDIYILLRYIKNDKKGSA